MGNASSENEVEETNEPKKKKSKKKKRKQRGRGPGIFSRLRDACMATIAALAGSHTNMLIYDNINLMSRIAEQVLGRKSECHVNCLEHLTGF